MDTIEKIRQMAVSGSLEDFARSLIDDRRALDRILVALSKGSPTDHELLAYILSVIPMESGESGTFRATDKREPKGKRYLDRFIAACSALRYPESEYIAVLISAQYAAADSELFGWNDAVDAYLLRRARDDFETVASYVDKYDKRFGKYDILMRVDPIAATDRLVNKVLFEKHINKSAARNALLGSNDLIEPLIELYDKLNAHERVALVRVFLLFKNDATVNDFLDNVVAQDKSKTVRDALARARATSAAQKKLSKLKKGGAVDFFETLLSGGEGLPYDVWKSVLGMGRGAEKTEVTAEYAAVADRLFFCKYTADGDVQILLFNDGSFLDLSDQKVKLGHDEKIYVLHPLDVSETDADILMLDIEQPILQLKRPIYYTLPDDMYSSARLLGTMIDREEFDANFKRLGFVSADDNGTKVAVKIIGDRAVAVSLGMNDNFDTLDCGKLRYYDASTIVKNGGKLFLSSADPLSIMSLEQKSYSELTYAAYGLFGHAEKS